MTIHAVAHWLEKTYKVDEEAKITQIDANLVSRKKDFEDMSPHNPDTLNQELNNLKALFELMRAG